MATSPQTKTSSAAFYVALLMISIGLIASGMLVLEHFGAMSLPGCGVGSACAAAAASQWGKLIGIPLSFIGLAHFVTMAVIVLATRGKLSRPLLFGACIAAMASLAYAGIAIGAQLICAYCMVVHAANVILAIVLTTASLPTWKGWLRPAIIGGIAGSAVYLVLLPLDLRYRSMLRERAEVALAESQRQMAAAAATNASTNNGQTAKTAVSGETKATPAQSDNTSQSLQRLFGRYPFGPTSAPIRIVMFTDYQCPDCYKIEQELKSLMQSVQGLSVGIRYFPLSSKCNPAMNGQDMHPNACWAARAAETAGMLGGSDAFWKMHHLLFERKGSFTDAEFPAMVQQVGFDPAEFSKVMQSATTEAVVKQDVDAGLAMGIYFTPMIFINGVELRGWQAPQALTRAVQSLAATNPVAMTSGEETAPDARTKYIEDWKAQQVVTVPASVKRRVLGPQDATIEVVMFGDLTEKNSVDADGILRLFTQGPKPNIKYTFAHFPIQSDCNPSTTLKRSPMACAVARAGEAIEAMNGAESYWQFHDYIMSHQQGLNDQTIREAIVAAGGDPATVLDAAKEPFIADIIASDAAAAQSLGIRGVPFIIINGRYVPRFKLNNENMLAAMIMDAAGPLPPAEQETQPSEPPEK